MRLCKNCYIYMTGVSSFFDGNMERFYQCPKCKSETKHRKLKEDELDFREVFHKEIQKRKTYKGRYV